MLPTHSRYAYSNITTRPDYSWPTGQRLAVYVALNIEQFSYGAGKGVAIAPPDQATSHSIFSWRDYGNRVGVWRLFELFDTLHIPVEAQMNIAVYEHCPDIPAKLRQRGDEIVGHGITNSEEQGHLSEDAEATLIRTVTETITRYEGQRPIGWMSPWLSNSEVTMDLLQEAGYRYVMDWTADDQPIWLKTRKGCGLTQIMADFRQIIWRKSLRSLCKHSTRAQTILPHNVAWPFLPFLLWCGRQVSAAMICGRKKPLTLSMASMLRKMLLPDNVAPQLFPQIFLAADTKICGKNVLGGLAILCVRNGLRARGKP